MNERTRRAYHVNHEMRELIKEGMILEVPRYSDNKELIRYFEYNGIQIEERYPEGDELSLNDVGNSS